MSIEEILAEWAEWQSRPENDGYCGFTICAISPDTSPIRPSVGHHQTEFMVAAQHADIALIIGALTTTLAMSSVLLVSDDSLADANSAPLRSLCFKQLNQHPWADPSWESVNTNAHMGSRSYESRSVVFSSGHPLNESIRFRGCRPAFVWSHPENDCDDRGRLSLVHQVFHDDVPAMHARRLTWESMRELQLAEVFAEQLIAIARGTVDRGDDDRFVPLRELFLYNKWSAEYGRVGETFSRVAEQRGYPLRELKDICENFELVTDTKHRVQSNNAAWITLAGQDAPRAFLEPPPAEQGVNICRVTCREPGLLVRILNDLDVCNDLRCRAMGSYRSPRLSIAALRETNVPWPSDAQHRDLFMRMDALKRVAEGIGEIGESIGGMFHGIRRSVETGPPWGYAWAFDRLRADIKEMRELSKEAGFGEFEGGMGLSMVAGEEDLPPAPIAILMRQLENEREPHHRLSLATNLGEAVVKMDVAVLLSVLKHLNPASIAKAFPKNNEKARKELRWTFGQWQAIQREASRCLTEIASGDAGNHASLWPFVVQLIGERKTVRDLAEKLVIMRNTNAHGATLSKIKCQQLVDTLKATTNEMLNVLGWYPRHMLYHLESVDRERMCTRVSRRVLVRAYEAAELQEIERPLGSWFESASVNEMYLEVGGDDLNISLYPWMQFAAHPEIDREVVWFLDSIRKGCVTYKSPQAAGIELEAHSSYEEVASLIGH